MVRVSLLLMIAASVLYASPCAASDATLTIPAAADVVVYRDEQDRVSAVSGVSGEVIAQSDEASLAIQAAIDFLPINGGKIYISAGSYELSDTIRITDKHGVHIQGAARGMQSGDQGGTVLRSEKDINLVEIFGDEFRIFGVTISDLLLWGSGKENGRAGILARGTTDVMTFSNVGANNHGIGFHLQGGGGSASGVLDAPQIYFCDPQRNGIGILVERSHYAKIFGGEFSDNREYGILIRSPSPQRQRIQAMKISGITAVRNHKAGIHIGSNAEDITVTGGSDVGGTREGSGIVIAADESGNPPRNILIGNVHTYNNLTAGVEVGRSDYVLIQGSIISEHDHHAVKRRGQKYGVLIGDDAKNVVMSGNINYGAAIADVHDLRAD